MRSVMLCNERHSRELALWRSFMKRFGSLPMFPTLVVEARMMCKGAGANRLQWISGRG
jgi:hypothetical protein